MLLERYEYENEPTFHQYDFFSKGPRGIIKKRVLYRFIGNLNGKNYYNLGFGDFHPEDNITSDLSISDNGDRDKILATVAFTAIEFTNHMQGCYIIAEESTPPRTRLYQMLIAKNYDEINEIFKIQGLTELGGWTHFTPGKNYVAFLISRK